MWISDEMTEALEQRPTLAVGQDADLKIDMEGIRVWLVRDPNARVGGTVAVERRVHVGTTTMWVPSVDTSGDFRAALQELHMLEWEWGL